MGWSYWFDLGDMAYPVLFDFLILEHGKASKSEENQRHDFAF